MNALETWSPPEHWHESYQIIAVELFERYSKLHPPEEAARLAELGTKAVCSGIGGLGVRPPERLADPKALTPELLRKPTAELKQMGFSERTLARKRRGR